ncbi:hypothetical protein LTR37_011149 [Vermiconidia calcicola]|uniref:Uncharacterized protein n=1 Tax=Vermiconidia calcicola TaxID=1690605 RepID=A0ACC3N2U6_9PEZI|nr:hypothetical protein LTR37_011149 [Vermiconidia calcicola]
MASILMRSLVCVWVLVAALSHAQTTSSGYVGYNLTLEGDEESVIYATDNTRVGAEENFPDPDVYLNASVHVGVIDLEVDNLTAKINIDAQVLNLSSFNAGVDLSIDRVRLLIQNVDAKVLLEARLENIVKMVNTTLKSIDLNPSIAELSEDVGEIVGSVGDALGSGSSSLSERSLSYELEHNILYSTNNYRANKHTNRILSQDGDIVDRYLDNDGELQGEKVVGNFKDDMTFNGYETTIERNGQTVTEREYTYSPYPGLVAISAVYTDIAGNVEGTQILAESRAGGSSTIAEDI